MKILVLNCGSSSVKYKLIDSESKAVLAEGGVEKIGLPDSFLKYKLPEGGDEGCQGCCEEYPQSSRGS
jgi:acetate kinase